jgi:hypothetical protein
VPLPCPRPSLSYSFCYRSCQLCHHSWPFMSFMVVYASSSGLIQSEIHVISCNLVQFMQFLEMHDIHVKSCNFLKCMTFMSNHAIQVNSWHTCQFIPFMTLMSIHVNSCQFIPFMSFDFSINSVKSGRVGGMVKYVLLGLW